MFSFLLNYIKGYIIFSAEGANIEGLLTSCIQNGIEIFDPKKESYLLSGKIRLWDYKKLHKPARKYGVKLKIKKKYGLYFFTKKNKIKIGFVIGLAYILIFNIIMNQFIWEINVIGNKETSSKNIIKSASEMGLVEGTVSKKHFVQDIEWYILNENSNLASVEINIQGSVANILINEKKKDSPMVSDDDIPVNLIASRYGVIRKIEVFDGQSNLKIGDAVMKGDLLVSAVFEDRHKKLTLKHARANIIAETDYNIKAEFPLKQNIETTGGIKKYIIVFTILGSDLQIGNDQNTKNLPTDVFEKQLSFFGIELPIKLIIKRFFNVKQNTITYNFEQGKKGAFKILEEKENELLNDCEIISRETEEMIKDGKYIVNANYVVLMNICEEQPLESDVPWKNTDDMS